MAEEKGTKTRRKRRTTKKRSVVDSAVRNAACLSDGCNPELVIGAEFDGVFEMPIIKKPKKIIIPDNLVPFSKMEKADPKLFAVCEYENDVEFKDILVHPDEYIEILKKYQGFISPDCSVYRDMPLAIQITNIYRSRAIGYCFQKHGVYVIPCVRWGDERTYTRKFLEELANNRDRYKGKDKYGNDWNIRLNDDGTQDWVRSQHQVINEGGRNKEPRPWDDETGLFRNPTKR